MEIEAFQLLPLLLMIVCWLELGLVAELDCVFELVKEIGGCKEHGIIITSLYACRVSLVTPGPPHTLIDRILASGTGCLTYFSKYGDSAIIVEGERQYL